MSRSLFMPFPEPMIHASLARSTANSTSDQVLVLSLNATTILTGKGCPVVPLAIPENENRGISLNFLVISITSFDVPQKTGLFIHFGTA